MSPARRILSGLALLSLAAAAGALSYAYNQAANRPFHAIAARAQAEHPSFVPGRSFVDALGGGFRNLVANVYYVRAVQYVGSFLRTSEYKLHLYDLYSAVTDLDPYFADVYEKGPLLLAFSEKAEPFTPEQKSAFAAQAVQLAKKGIANLCDAKKVAAAGSGADVARLASDPATAEPCGSHDQIPYFLGYITYRYLKDEASAAYWYRVAAAHKDAPGAAKYMVGLMEGRAGDREKAALTFLSLAVEQGGQDCRATASAASDALFPVLRDGADARLDRRLLTTFAQAEAQLRDRFGDLDSCALNFARALRETNLLYLERADAAYFKAKGRHAAQASDLARAGFAQFVPADPSTPQDGHVARYFWDPQQGRWSWGYSLPQQ